MTDVRRRRLGAALPPCEHEDHETNNTEHPFPGAHAGNRRDEDDDRGHCRDCESENQPFENRRHRLKKSGRLFFVSRRISMTAARSSAESLAYGFPENLTGEHLGF